MTEGRYYGVRWVTITQRWTVVEVWRDDFVSKVAARVSGRSLHNNRHDAEVEAERMNALRALERGP